MLGVSWLWHAGCFVQELGVSWLWHAGCFVQELGVSWLWHAGCFVQELGVSWLWHAGCFVQELGVSWLWHAGCFVQELGVSWLWHAGCFVQELGVSWLWHAGCFVQELGVSWLWHVCFLLSPVGQMTMCLSTLLTMEVLVFWPSPVKWWVNFLSFPNQAIVMVSQLPFQLTWCQLPFQMPQWISFLSNWHGVSFLAKCRGESASLMPWWVGFLPEWYGEVVSCHSGSCTMTSESLVVWNTARLWHCKLRHGWMVYTELAPKWQQFQVAISTPLPWILKICTMKGYNQNYITWVQWVCMRAENSAI